MPRPMPEHLKVLLENIAQKAKETESLETATHKDPVQVDTASDGTASFARTPIEGRDANGDARNAVYRGEGSSNATVNTRQIRVNTNLNVAAVKT